METMKNVKLCKVDFTLFLWKMCFDAISILSSAAFSKKQKRKEKNSLSLGEYVAHW